MATSLDDIQPLDLASIRDDAPERPPWSSRATATDRAGGRRDPAGRSSPPSSAIACRSDPAVRSPSCWSAAWALAAVFVAVHRPREPLAVIVAARRVRGRGRAVRRRRWPDATSPRRPCATSARASAASRSRSSLRSALHLVLGLPDGALGDARSADLGPSPGYVASVGAGGRARRTTAPTSRSRRSWSSSRPTRSWAWSATSPRYRAAATVQERARLQWPAWGVVVAAAISLAAWVLHELLSWPEPIVRIVVLATTVLDPARRSRSARRSGSSVRIDRLLVHTITIAGLAAMVGGVVPAHRARARPLADRRREDAARPLDARRRGRRAAVDSRARAAHRVRDPARLRRAARARRGAPHVRQPPHPRAPARRAAAAAGRVAEEDDVARASPRSGRAARPAASSARCRCPTAARRRSRSGRRRRRSSRAPACRARRGRASGCPRSSPADDEVLRGRADHQLRRAARPDRRAPTRRVRCRSTRHDDQALTELARQVGLALHNVKLDSALQESLDEVRRQADELRASRARIVEAGDARAAPDRARPARRRAAAPRRAGGERATSSRQIADTDPDTAKAMLEQIGSDLQEAVQELRNLAHGIYPPLLMDRGLRRGAVGRRRPRRAADRRRGRGHRPLPAAGRGGGLLLLPRGAAERGQARGRRRSRR